MPYVSPTIVPSGTTFAQLQAGGFGAELKRLIAANDFPPAVDSLLSGDFETLHRAIVHLVDAYLRGDPVAANDVNTKLLYFATALKTILTAIEEVNALVAANTGTLKNVPTTAATGHQLRRTFP